MKPKHIDTQIRRLHQFILGAEGQVAQRQPVDEFLRRQYREHKELGSRDRRLISNTVFSWFRWKGWTDNLALAAYLDLTERQAALDSMLEESGLVSSRVIPSGLLDVPGKAERLREWLNLEDAPSTTALFPEDMPDIPEEDLVSFQSRPPVWIRARRRFQNRVETGLKAKGIPAQPHPHIPLAYRIDDLPAFNRFRPQNLGRFEIQDIASQAVGAVCDPQPRQKWWDACCGGGGKTLLLNELMQYEGHILATDNRRRAIDSFRRRDRKGNLNGVEMHVMDVSKENLADQRFDGVLVDAPCAGIGTWGRNPDARWRFDAKLYRHGVERQKAILGAVCSAVAGGGKLVYSVCSLGTEETDRVVDQFLEQYPEFQLEAFANPMHPEQQVERLTLRPSEIDGIGMYVVQFRKTEHKNSFY